MSNIDKKTVASFGDEWSRFDQTGMTENESRKIFDEYFFLFPWNSLPENAEGFDMGCGSGRWAKWVAPQVGILHCIDPSDAIYVAKSALNAYGNVDFIKSSLDATSLPLSSQDFGYSLGVLHHVPDTRAAISSCVALLKPGAPLLLYLYYAFDNRGWIYKSVWRFSDIARKVICSLPSLIKHMITDLIAILIYLPLAKLSKFMEILGLRVDMIPLSYYRKHSFYTMRTDARDRFGTPLEKRFTKLEIKKMMNQAGLENIRFSESAPFWCSIGFKKAENK